MYLKIIKLSFLCVLVFLVSCKKKTTDPNAKYQDTPISGHAVIGVDKSIQTLAENLVYIFEHQYPKANLDAIYTTERDLLELMKKDSVVMGVLSRPLNAEELAFFESKKIRPIQQHFATDALAIISSNTSDTTFTTEELKKIFDGTNEYYKGIVFSQQNYNSLSTIMNYMNLKSESDLPKHFYSMDHMDSLINYLSSNTKAIGLIPRKNWEENSEKYLARKLQLIGIEGTDTSGRHYTSYPYQSYVADQTYPLVRKLYTVCIESRSGLGTGFATFLSGDIGRRIIVQQGSIPLEMPVREVIIRDDWNDKTIK